jgi:hypothetical protein
MGTPTQEEWAEGYRLAAAMNFRFQQCQGVPLETIINTAGTDAMKLMIDMMLWVPEKRPSAANCLKYKYFQVNQKLGAPSVSQPVTSMNRKNSANSTQSDSKLFVNKSKVAKIGNSQKIGPSESPIPPSIPDQILKDDPSIAAAAAAPKKLSAPKDGSDRTINRNLPLNKTTAPPTNEPTEKAATLADRTNRALSGKKDPVKDIYLAKSRYVPGVVKNENGNNASNALNNTLRVGKPQNNSAANQARSAVQARFEYAYGYVPSFGVKNNPAAQNQNQNNAPENPLSNTQKVTTTGGRTNWAAKYSK